MEDDFYEEERHRSSRKLKRLGNKRERLQIKNYLKGNSPKDFINDDIDEDDYDILYKN